MIRICNKRKHAVSIIVLAVLATGCGRTAAPSPEAVKMQLIADIENKFNWTDVDLTEQQPNFYTGTATIEGQYPVDVEVKKLHDGVEAKWSSDDGKVTGEVIARW